MRGGERRSSDVLTAVVVASDVVVTTRGQDEGSGRLRLAVGACVSPLPPPTTTTTTYCPISTQRSAGGRSRLTVCRSGVRGMRPSFTSRRAVLVVQLGEDCLADLPCVHWEKRRRSGGERGGEG